MKVIITGYFGSGKTEIAMQMAMDRAQAGNHTTLVDLDIVNPYFTSSAHRDALEARGVELISPGFANTNVDAPLLTGGIRRAMLDITGDTVVDLGGDATGATVLGSLASQGMAGGFILLLIVNVYRPFTQTTDEIEALLDILQAHARMPVAGLINNANMLEETEPKHLLHGEDVLCKVCAKTGVPILYHAGTADVLKSTGGRLSGEPVVLCPHRPQWLSE